VSPFATILQRAVEATPGAVGGAFAASDGEMVDSFATGAGTDRVYDADELAMLTAHYGIVLTQLCSAFGTWHFGGPEYFIAQHTRLDVVVHAVDNGYYVLLAMTEPAPLAMALVSVRAAATALKREMA
jgi:hypothetical protein